MAWRGGDFFGVTFEDQSSSSPSETGGVTEAEPELDADFESTFLTLADAQQLARTASQEMLTEFAENSEQASQSNIHFAVGVAVVLALPALISLGAYIAAALALRIANG